MNSYINSSVIQMNSSSDSFRYFTISICNNNLYKMAQNIGRRELQDAIEKIKASNAREDLMFSLPFQCII